MIKPNDKLTDREQAVETEQASETPVVRLAAVGDLLLTTDPTGRAGIRDGKVVFSEISQFFDQHDVVLGNLECTLPADGPTVPTEPRVITTGEMVEAVGAAGFNIVCLANNHTFDCGWQGYEQLQRLLDELGIRYFGAGADLKTAAAPAIMTVNGLRLAFLGVAAQGIGVSDFASCDQMGVPQLDADLLAEQITQLCKQVDHVIVSVHWGEERLLVPSPQQVNQARAMIDAGASLVLGHHPHVMQGLESYGKGAIVYSLGNFVSSEVYFTSGDIIHWNRTERTGSVLVAELDKQGVRNVSQVPTHDTGRCIELDQSSFGQRLIARLNRTVTRGVTLRRYRWEHLRVKTIKPMLSYLRWSKLKTLRLRQVRNALASVLNSGRAE